MHKKSEAKWKDIKMQCVGFSKKKGYGMKFHYNFRFEKELGDYFVYPRVACSCMGCYNKLQELIEIRYSGPSNDCGLWPIMNKKDGGGVGYNDWKKASFVERNDCDEEQVHASKADALKNVGSVYSQEVEVGNFIGYGVDDPRYNNYFLHGLMKMLVAFEC